MPGMPAVGGTALLITLGLLGDSAAKTAHGLIRDGDRFEVVGVVDPVLAGLDAGAVIGVGALGIPVFATVSDALRRLPATPRWAVLGAAPSGGRVTPEALAVVREVLENGMSVVSGLHDLLGDIPDLAALAVRRELSIVDVRRPPARGDLHFWTGKIREVTSPRIAVLGTDVKIGKRTTARLLTRACDRAGIRAQLVYTGQTGWMQGCRYGFVVDTTINDFVAGELEHAVHTCWRETKPAVIFIEGQSGLRYPPSPAGAAYVTSVGARHVVLQHAPARVHYDNDPSLGPIPPVESEIELIQMYDTEVVAVTLNMAGCPSDTVDQVRREYEQRLDVPVVLPLHEGVDALVPVIADAVGLTSAP